MFSVHMLLYSVPTYFVHILSYTNFFAYIKPMWIKPHRLYSDVNFGSCNSDVRYRMSAHSMYCR